MFRKLYAASPSSPDLTTQAPLAVNGKRFGKKLYVVITAVVTIAIIAVALMIPQGAASIPLNANYNVGEKMIYDITATVNYDLGQLSELLPSNVTVGGQQTIEVLSFDGQSYTLNHTATMIVNNTPFSYSIIETMAKTGYSAYLLNMGGASQGISTSDVPGNSYLAKLLSKSEVKVGDSISIPYPDNGSMMGVTGGLTLTFKGIEDLKVPAGTFKVFRVDLTSDNLQMDLSQLAENLGGSSIVSGSMKIDINYQIYIEYGTMRLVQSTVQEGISIQATALQDANYSMDITMDMALNQYIQP